MRLECSVPATGKKELGGIMVKKKKSNENVHSRFSKAVEKGEADDLGVVVCYIIILK